MADTAPPTANGTVKSTNGVNWTGKFYIGPNGIPYTFTGTFAKGVATFHSADNAVTLTYNAKDDLTGAQHFTGEIGTGNIDLKFDNGPTIKGPLLKGPATPAQVEGDGNWLPGADE